MKSRKISVCLLAVALSISMIFPGGVPGSVPQTAQAMTVLETTVTEASEDCTLFGLYGSYHTRAQEALDRLNEIRKEACEAGNVPDPRDPYRMLTPDDYVPLKWSRDLENIARIRAMEGMISYRFMDSGHDRLNNKDTYSVESNGLNSSAEDLAFYYNANMLEGVTMWHMEKKHWLDWENTTWETGHYASIINPKFRYVGLGEFYCEAGYYPNVLAGELSVREDLDETMQAAPEDVMQKIEISNRYIDHYFLEGSDEVDTGKTITFVPKVQIRRNNATRNLWLLGSVTWKSSDPSLASVDASGTVTGYKSGTVTITAYAEEYKTTITKKIKVNCTHDKKIVSYDRPTCTSTGKKVYYCQVCDDTTEQEVPKAAHDYVYGAADADGKRQGVCKNCGDTIRIVPPTLLQLWWGKTGEPYTDTFPDAAAPGDTMNFCPVVSDGDSGYTDVILETTDASVVSVPETDYPSGSIHQITIEGNGIATLSAYLKYNPSVRKDVVVRSGEKGSIPLAAASITLERTTYTYNGEKCTPEVTVAYRDSILEKNVDYTVSYEKNTMAGTAAAVITGKGILSGTVRKEFTIQPAASGGHTSQDDAPDYHELEFHKAAEPTCEEPGNIDYYYCTDCGNYYLDEDAKQLIFRQDTEIRALGHDWESDVTIDIPATETTEGERSVHCRRCNARKDIEVIPPVGSDTDDDGGSGDGSEDDGDSDTGGTDNSAGSGISGSSVIRYTIYSKGSTLQYNGIYYRVLTAAGKKRIASAAVCGIKNRKKKTVTLPAAFTYKGVRYNVTAIGRHAFAGCRKVTQVTIPSSVKKIEAKAFTGASKLKKITIKSSLLTKKKVSSQAFAGLSKKTVVKVPSNKKASYKKFIKGVSVQAKSLKVSAKEKKSIKKICQEFTTFLGLQLIDENEDTKIPVGKSTTWKFQDWGKENLKYKYNMTAALCYMEGRTPAKRVFGIKAFYTTPVTGDWGSAGPNLAVKSMTKKSSARYTANGDVMWVSEVDASKKLGTVTFTLKKKKNTYYGFVVKSVKIKKIRSI